MIMDNTVTTAARIILFLLLQIVNGEDAAVDDDSCFMDGNNTAALRHNQRCEAALADERNHISTFYMTSGASITALISGSLSAVSSIIILILIRRSSIGLSSVYHRIICGMAIADMFASAAIAFGTAPLPKDVIYGFDPGWVHGNQTTCVIQGFSVNAFLPISMMFHTMLSIYYVLTINFKKRDAELKKNEMFTLVLPVIGTILMLVGPVLALFAGSFNPKPFDAWCGISAYPYYCLDKDEDVNNCLTGGNKISSVLFVWTIGLIFVLQILNMTTVVALISVVIGVFRQDRYIKEMHKLFYGNSRLQSDGSRMLASTKKRQTFTKALSVQCAAYILTHLLCYLSMLAHVGQSGDQKWGMQFYHVFFRPLQGLFNLLIFVSHKAYDHKVMNQSLTVTQAIINVFRDKEEEKHFISNISLVRDDHSFYFDGDEEEVAMYDVDERGDEVDVIDENLNAGDESGISFADDDGERNIPLSSNSSNFSKLFGSWISQETRSRLGSLGSINSGAVSSVGLAET